MNTCWNCQAPVPDGAQQCERCGTVLALPAEPPAAEPDLPCRQCGEAVPYASLFCGWCGARDPHGSPGVVELDRNEPEREANLVDAVEPPAPVDRTAVSPATLAAQAIEELQADDRRTEIDTNAPARPIVPVAVDLDDDVAIARSPTESAAERGATLRRYAEPAPVVHPDDDTLQETRRAERREKLRTQQSITAKPRALQNAKPAAAGSSTAPGARGSTGRAKLEVKPAPRPEPGAAKSNDAAKPRKPATVIDSEPPRGVGGDAVAAKARTRETAAVRDESGSAPGSDLADGIAEIRFFVLQDLDDEARAALASLRESYPDHPDLDAVEREIEARGSTPTGAPPQRAAEDQAKREAEAQAKRDAEAQAKRDAEAQAKRDAEAQAKAKRDAEAQAKRDAEAQAKAKRDAEAQAKAKREAEAQAKRDAEAQAKREAEAQAKRDAEAQAKRDADAQAQRHAQEQVMRDAEDQTRSAAEAAERALTQAEQERLEEAARADRAEASARRLTAEEQAALDEAQRTAEVARQAEREAREAEHAAEQARERALRKRREAERAAAAAEAAQRLARRVGVSREVKVAVAERVKAAELAKAAEVARATEAARIARDAEEAARQSAPEAASADAIESAAPVSDVELDAIESDALVPDVDVELPEDFLDESGSDVVDLGLPDDLVADDMPPPIGAIPIADDDADLSESDEAALAHVVAARRSRAGAVIEVELDDDVEDIEEIEEIDEDAVEIRPRPGLDAEDMPRPEELQVDLHDLDELAPDPGPARTGRTIPPGSVTAASLRAQALATEGTVVTQGPQPASPYDRVGSDRDAARRIRTVLPGDPSRPAAPAPYGDAARPEPEPPALVTADLVGAAAASGEFKSEENTEPSPPPQAAAVARTHDGTVIAPMPGQKGAIPVAPIRLVALGPEGAPLVERIVGPGQSYEIGRHPGDPWVVDTKMQPRHVKVRPAPGGIVVDELTPDGAVFIRLSERSAIRDGDELKVGQSALRYDRLPAGVDTGVLGHITVHKFGAPAPEAYPVAGAGLLFGRDEGDVVFPDDTFVSGQHCRFTCEGHDVYVEDLGSSNGTYLRVRNGEPVAFGSLILVGHTRFTIEPV